MVGLQRGLGDGRHAGLQDQSIDGKHEGEAARGSGQSGLGAERP
jgi:hypothetical protein